jgi:hypothetical protein
MGKILLAGAVVAAVLGAVGLWFAGAGNDTAPAVAGAVMINAAAPVAAPVMAAPAASLPTPPDQVIAHVREAYPLLTDVDFACDASGCAVTALIPPPTGDAFLQKRQEMLLGGLARTIAADGYEALGPVQMDEISFNTFRIRAVVRQAK